MNITGQPPPFPAPPASDVHYRRYMTCVGEEEREGRASWRGRICTELESILLTPSQISIHAESKARVLLLRNMKGESVGLSPVAAVFAHPAIAVWGHCKMHLYLTVYH